MQNPWKVILAFVGVFVAGAVFGGFLALRLGRELIVPQPQVAALPIAPTVVPPVVKPPLPPGQAPPNLPVPQSVQSAQLLRRLTNQLDLTPAQRERVVPIIQRAVQDFWREQQNFSRENAFLLQRLKQDMGKELTPDQQKRLDEMWLKQLEGMRKRQAEAQAQRQAVSAPPPGDRPTPPAPAEPAKPATDSAAKPPADGGK